MIMTDSFSGIKVGNGVVELAIVTGSFGLFRAEAFRRESFEGFSRQVHQGSEFPKNVSQFDVFHAAFTKSWVVVVIA